jgi:serine protease Do
MQQDGTALRAEVMGVSPCDLAVLEGRHGASPRGTRVRRERSRPDRRQVVAVGNPLGIGTSVSMGVLSALHGDIRADPFDNFIQTGAAIDHGNSGRPLIA